METDKRENLKEDLQYSPTKTRRRESAPVIHAPPIKRSPAQNVCLVMGVVFLLAGLAGFVMPHMAGAHLGTTHNFIHLVSGIAALWFGTGKSAVAAKKFSRYFGGFYLLLGLSGFVFGGGRADSLITPIPGVLTLGTTDHWLHVAFGLIFLVGAYFTLRRNKKVTYH